ncbi:TetR/AcrR family transcriptional regulator [Micromonospora echinofusca]|uniref:TetR/AcrR family transcriptional regulator n=1 Tax=Micromonospora echinofusca TaxID=47858 RepID=UPI0033C3849B
MPARERDTARTRRVVLDAAARAVVAHGAGVSLDLIARTAGVSKGGLLHHFRSREQLLLELARDLAEQFTAAVHATVDPRDHARGRLVRGYVRATLDGLGDGSTVPEHVILAASLAGVPGVAELLQEDNRRWDEALEADGLDPDRVRLITLAADGAAVAGLYGGGTDPDDARRLRELLIRLSTDEGPLVGPA